MEKAALTAPDLLLHTKPRNGDKPTVANKVNKVNKTNKAVSGPPQGGLSRAGYTMTKKTRTSHGICRYTRDCGVATNQTYCRPQDHWDRSWERHHRQGVTSATGFCHCLCPSDLESSNEVLS